MLVLWFYFVFFKQKTAYEMRISDWSSDVCSSDLHRMPERSVRDRIGRTRLRRNPAQRSLLLGAAPLRRSRLFDNPRLARLSKYHIHGFDTPTPGSTAK